MRFVTQFMVVLLMGCVGVGVLVAQPPLVEITPANAAQLQVLATLNAGHTRSQFLTVENTAVLTSLDTIEIDPEDFQSDLVTQLQFWDMASWRVTKSLTANLMGGTMYRYWDVPQVERVIILSTGGVMRVRDTRTLSKIGEVLSSASYRTTATISADRRLFAYSSCKHGEGLGFVCVTDSWNIQIFDTHTLEITAIMPLLTGDVGVDSIGLSDDGQRLLVRLENGTNTVRDVATGREIASEVRKCYFGRMDGDIIFYSATEVLLSESQCDKTYTLRLWDYAAQTERYLLTGVQSEFSPWLALSPDRQLVALKTRQRLYIVDILAGTTLVDKEIYGDGVAFSADGHYLIAGGSVLGVLDG